MWGNIPPPTSRSFLCLQWISHYSWPVTVHSSHPEQFPDLEVVHTYWTSSGGLLCSFPYPQRQLPSHTLTFSSWLTSDITSLENLPDGVPFPYCVLCLSLALHLQCNLIFLLVSIQQHTNKSKHVFHAAWPLNGSQILHLVLNWGIYDLFPYWGCVITLCDRFTELLQFVV